MDISEEYSSVENKCSDGNDSCRLIPGVSLSSESLDFRISKIERIISRLSNELNVLKDNFKNIVIQNKSCRRKINNITSFHRRARKKLYELERMIGDCHHSSCCCVRQSIAKIPCDEELSEKISCRSYSNRKADNAGIAATSPQKSVSETLTRDALLSDSGKVTVPFETFIIKDCDGCGEISGDNEENSVSNHPQNSASCEDNSINHSDCSSAVSVANSTYSLSETNGEACPTDVAEHAFFRLHHNFDSKTADMVKEESLLKEDMGFKYSGCPVNSMFSSHGNELDTFDIARRVRELLSVHNIGQRIFAKYVLGLSQGTVSELLSKPKPWMKLTEKGRDSYRKMWHWANSNDGIMALKSLSPRRGFKDSHYYKSVKEDPEVEEKIVQILSDAQRQMQIAKDNNNDSNLALVIKNENSQDLICSNKSNNFADSHSYAYKSKSNASDSSKLLNNGNIKPTEVPLDLSIKLECRQYEDDTRESTSQSNSPLHHIQTITDSLSNGNATFNHLNVKPLKAVLPPISQAHIELFSFIDTEELVKEIKDFLGKYCVSQRQFGEVVLGLSQGSVSDLLARPKSWSALTQKGREPFIRMKLFLNDPNSYHRLFKTNKTYNEIKRNSGKSFNVKHESYADEGTLKTETFDDYAAEDLAEYAASRDSSEDNDVRSPISLPAYSLPQCTIPAELDTEVISSRVKELLTISNIGQRIFGEAVLNLSQGTVSELLSKPKSWYALSVKGREPYARMYSWLQDPQNVEKLTEWKIEKELMDKNYPYAVLEMQRQKRRFVFNDEQRKALKSVFDSVPYPNMGTIEALAKSLNLQTNKIINWFHNQRMRMKQKNASSEVLKEETSYVTNENSSSVDITSECNKNDMNEQPVSEEETKFHECHFVDTACTTETMSLPDAACLVRENNYSKKRLCKYDSYSSNKRRKSVPQKRLDYCGNENYIRLLHKQRNEKSYSETRPAKEPQNLDFYNVNQASDGYINKQSESILNSDKHCLPTAINNCVSK